MSDTDLKAGRRALVFAALSFIPTLVLAIVQGHAIAPQPQRAFLHDFSAYAMVIAIAAFVLMEQSSDTRMQLLVKSFSLRGLVSSEAQPCFENARRRMEHRTRLAWVEWVLALAAYVIAYEWLYHLILRIDGGTWAGQVIDGKLRLTLAGMWAAAVTMPLFLFLLGRWLWRFVTWGLLLRDLARCEMRLVATHADRCGGLAFIGQYPSTYMLFVFAVSTMLSAGVLKQVIHADVDLLVFKFAALGLIVFLMLAFVLPLVAFTPTLLRLKRRGLRIYGGLISRHNRAFERKWCADQAPADDEMLGAPDMSSLADLSMSYDMVKRMLPVPVVKEGILPLLVAVLLPMAAVAATQAPVKQVLNALKGMLLI
ncbi:MAG TPA: hypothetical protein VEP93_09485 [Variovorax sp.]|nr:hypothetical protein [Variovorax sp.]